MAMPRLERFIDNLPSMDLMRSEKMALVQLIIPVESAHRAITYLGELGLLQLRDLNEDKSPFHRTFANQVKRCGEMSRKLRFLKDQIHKAGLVLPVHIDMEPDIELDQIHKAGLVLFYYMILSFRITLASTMKLRRRQWIFN